EGGQHDPVGGAGDCGMVHVQSGPDRRESLPASATDRAATPDATPRLRDGDRRFWILACRWVPRWRESLLVVQPATVLGWHRRGRTAYWRWRSRCRRGGGRPRITGSCGLRIVRKRRPCSGRAVIVPQQSAQPLAAANEGA